MEIQKKGGSLRRFLEHAFRLIMNSLVYTFCIVVICKNVYNYALNKTFV